MLLHELVGFLHVFLRLCTIELNLASFNMHVRLPEREGVDVRGRVQVRETVIHESMGGFIRPDSIQNVEKLRVWTQTPIVDGNFWSFEISPFRNFSVFQVCDTACTEGKRVTTLRMQNKEKETAY